MPPIRRETNPKVRDGKVQRKNRTALSPHYSQTPQDRPAVDRQRPGEGYRHLLTKQQIYQFIDLLPDWQELSRGLNAVVLAPGNYRAMGWHQPGIVAICAWEGELEREWDVDFIADHRSVLDRLGVPVGPIFDDVEDEKKWQPNSDYQLCRFTETSTRGFQLMHIFLHELGHHHDRVTTRSKRQASRGEGYAEQYAARYVEQIWERYFKVFGW
jgi:hypothetical protein